MGIGVKEESLVVVRNELPEECNGRPPAPPEAMDGYPTRLSNFSVYCQTCHTIHKRRLYPTPTGMHIAWNCIMITTPLPPFPPGGKRCPKNSITISAKRGTHHECGQTQITPCRKRFYHYPTSKRTACRKMSCRIFHWSRQEKIH